MKDLTQGSIPRHLIQMAIPIGIGMFVQTLYFLVDLYFVSQLGDAALAGVSAAGNATFMVIALTQILNIGTATLISHAVGRKDKTDANLIFNQASFYAIALTLISLAVGYGYADQYMHLLASDSQVKQAGTTYLYWFLPNMALQFLMVTLFSALRGTGIVKPTMAIQLLTLLLNIILAPVLIAGWGTGFPMGVAGAGLASSVSMVIGVVILFAYFIRVEHYVTFDFHLWWPQRNSLIRLLKVGFPSGAEFLLMFVYMALIYWLIQGFGAAAQAGFGLGSRIMQALFLPALALAFAAPAIAGQNFGAGQFERVRQTFKWTLVLSCSLMFVLTLVCLWEADMLIAGFSSDPDVLLVASSFLAMVCWNFIPSGVVFTCAGLFQGMGHTWPGMLSTALRIITFALPALWLSQQPDFALTHLWLLSVTSVILQCLASVVLVRWQMAKHLNLVVA